MLLAAPLALLGSAPSLVLLVLIAGALGLAFYLVQRVHRGVRGAQRQRAVSNACAAPGTATDTVFVAVLCAQRGRASAARCADTVVSALAEASCPSRVFVGVAHWLGAPSELDQHLEASASRAADVDAVLVRENVHQLRLADDVSPLHGLSRLLRAHYRNEKYVVLAGDGWTFLEQWDETLVRAAQKAPALTNNLTLRHAGAATQRRSVYVLAPGRRQEITLQLDSAPGDTSMRLVPAAAFYGLDLAGEASAVCELIRRAIKLAQGGTTSVTLGMIAASYEAGAPTPMCTVWPLATVAPGVTTSWRLATGTKWRDVAEMPVWLLRVQHGLGVNFLESTISARAEHGLTNHPSEAEVRVKVGCSRSAYAASSPQ